MRKTDTLPQRKIIKTLTTWKAGASKIRMVELSCGHTRACAMDITMVGCPTCGGVVKKKTARSDDGPVRTPVCTECVRKGKKAPNHALPGRKLCQACTDRSRSAKRHQSASPVAAEAEVRVPFTPLVEAVASA